VFPTLVLRAMQAKGTIRQTLQWRDARRFFYWRVRRRLNEELFLRKLAVAEAGSPRAANLARLKSLVVEDDNSTVFEDNDRLVAMWYEDNKKDVLLKVEALRQDSVAATVAGLIGENGRCAFNGVATALAKFPQEQREQILKLLATPLPEEKAKQ